LKTVACFSRIGVDTVAIVFFINRGAFFLTMAAVDRPIVTSPKTMSKYHLPRRAEANPKVRVLVAGIRLNALAIDPGTAAILRKAMRSGVRMPK
jgi:hypothetical protein